MFLLTTKTSFSARTPAIRDFTRFFIGFCLRRKTLCDGFPWILIFSSSLLRPPPFSLVTLFYMKISTDLAEFQSKFFKWNFGEDRMSSSWDILDLRLLKYNSAVAETWKVMVRNRQIWLSFFPKKYKQIPLTSMNA